MEDVMGNLAVGKELAVALETMLDGDRERLRSEVRQLVVAWASELRMPEWQVAVCLEEAVRTARVKFPTPAEAAGTRPAPKGLLSRDCFIIVDEDKLGPYSVDSLNSMLESARITARANPNYTPIRIGAGSGEVRFVGLNMTDEDQRRLAKIPGVKMVPLDDKTLALHSRRMPR